MNAKGGRRMNAEGVVIAFEADGGGDALSVELPEFRQFGNDCAGADLCETGGCLNQVASRLLFADFT